ncbi:hypothetical protein E4U42_004616 [Claviceps africana]|uniref:Uncharacterized protein n=1 Tax=Claviceps africana TaxID=83212 RepID=A0A8K0NKN6_9HYPO|nr:hypothetical protein E4U42_004616 [Claviceps africana]
MTFDVGRGEPWQADGAWTLKQSAWHLATVYPHDAVLVSSSALSAKCFGWIDPTSGPALVRASAEVSMRKASLTSHPCRPVVARDLAKMRIAVAQAPDAGR